MRRVAGSLPLPRTQTKGQDPATRRTSAKLSEKFAPHFTPKHDCIVVHSVQTEGPERLFQQWQWGPASQVSGAFSPQGSVYCPHTSVQQLPATVSFHTERTMHLCPLSRAVTGRGPVRAVGMCPGTDPGKQRQRAHELVPVVLQRPIPAIASGTYHA